MKRILAIIIFVIAVCGCSNSADTNNTSSATTDKAQLEAPSFFPVTSYIKGQIYTIANAFTPLKYTTVNGHTDSVWLKAEELDLAFAEFLSPQIDSTNLIHLFTESKFKDRSYNDAFTFTYEPTKELPDTMALRQWTVYIDPEKNTVKKIYLNKLKGDKEIQLTWQNDKWCTIVTIAHNADGTSKIEKEEKITWDF